jgi:phosphoglycerol transferase MdoB-like AlkP superfamily enzyme
VVTTAIAAIFISEFLYYRYSSGFLEFSALFYARQTDELWGTISALLSPKLLAFALSPVLVIISFFVTRKFPISDKCKTKFVWRKTIAAIIVVVFFLGGYGTVLGAEKKDWETQHVCTANSMIWVLLSGK